MYSTEQLTGARQETAQRVLKLASCPGPIQELAAPMNGPKYVMPATTILESSLTVACWLAPQNVSPPEFPELAPELPPPRRSHRSVLA